MYNFGSSCIDEWDECSRVRVLRNILNSNLNWFVFISYSNGAWQMSFGSNRRNEHTRVVSLRGVAHPQYTVGQNIRHNDIGIIFVDQPIQFTANVFPISMSWKTDTRLTDENVQGMIVGFAPGTGNPGPEGTNILQMAHVRIISEGLCRPLFPQMNPISLFCAVDDRMSNFCDGDQVKLRNSLSHYWILTNLIYRADLWL